jgi:hypothetical protein
MLMLPGLSDPNVDIRWPVGSSPWAGLGMFRAADRYAYSWLWKHCLFSFIYQRRKGRLYVHSTNLAA